MLGVSVPVGTGGRPRHGVVVLIICLLVGGVLSMHALAGASVVGSDHSTPQLSESAPVLDTGALADNPETSSSDVLHAGAVPVLPDNGGGQGHAGHVLSGVCLALLAALFLSLFLLSNPRFGSTVEDRFAHRFQGWFQHTRAARRPNLHALSILRC